MAPLLLNTFTLVLTVLLTSVNGDDAFNQNYFNHWGQNHFALVDQGSEVQLRLDKASGGAGFRSKYMYGSGHFHIRIKLPPQISNGTNTNFYLNSAKYGDDGRRHDEIDIELLGTGPTTILQTNVFSMDLGHREQQFHLWFDPSEDFHSYEIRWNSRWIIFYVDKIAIRVFKNNKAIGVKFPNKPMRIESSIWNADWAGQIDWSKEPFIASYRDFSISGCRCLTQKNCSSSNFWWNVGPDWDLNPFEKRRLTKYKKKYMIYDYCTKYSDINPECKINP